MPIATIAVPRLIRCEIEKTTNVMNINRQYFVSRYLVPVGQIHSPSNEQILQDELGRRGEATLEF